MKKVFYIQAINLMNANQIGFIKQSDDPNSQIKLFKSKVDALIHLENNKNFLRAGWAHTPCETYIIDKNIKEE